MPKIDPKKLILVVIDGLTPAMLEDAVERRATPWLAFLADHGSYRRAVSTFPSLTPVCLASIATGAHSDVHEIPHLVWWHRGRERLVADRTSRGGARRARGGGCCWGSRSRPRCHQTRCGISWTSPCAPVAIEEGEPGGRDGNVETERRYDPWSARNASHGVPRRSTASSSVGGPPTAL